MYYDVVYGVMNLFEWLPIIWFDRDWDHSFLLTLLEFKFSRMAKVQSNGHSMSGPRYAKQLRVCAELARRLNEDDYDGRAGGNNRRYSRGYFKKQDAMRKQDQELLGKMIARHITCWWD